MKEFFKSLKQGFERVFFPERLTCELCGRDVFDKELLCERCKGEIVFIGDEICPRCGRSCQSGEKGGCVSCKLTPHVDLSRSAISYEGGGEKLIKKFKYAGARYLAKEFADMLKVVYFKNFFAPDVMTFVPMTDKKKYQRGYNQSELIALSLAEKTGAKCVELFEKVKETKHQAGLGFEDRRSNLSGSFRLKNARSVKNKKVLIIDDVLTTGATAEELAEILKGKGAKSVYLLTVASVGKNIQEQ